MLSGITFDSYLGKSGFQLKVTYFDRNMLLFEEAEFGRIQSRLPSKGFDGFKEGNLWSFKFCIVVDDGIMLLNYFWLKYWPIQDLWWRARHILGNKFSTLSRVRVLKKLYGSFLWITSPRLQSHYENAAYFNSLSALELLVLIVLTFDWSKVESVMEMYNVVEPPM